MKKTLLIIFLSFIFNSYAQEIKIKDNNLKAALLDKFDKNLNGKVEKVEIENVTELKLDERNIENIEALKYFKNLKILNLRKNRISNFSTLNKLVNLEELYIGDNKRVEKLNLKKLTKLRGIYAFRLGLSKIELNSQNLKYIYLQDNLFIDFDARKFPNLHTLNLDGCKPLTSINISNNLHLVQLYLLGTSINEINVSNNKLLKTMYIESSVKLIKAQDQEYLEPAPIIRVQ